MTLYQINEELEQALMNSVDPDTGEIIEDTSALDALAIARDEKIENIALYIKNSKALAEAIRAEEQKLAARRKTAENRAEWLKQYLSKNLAGEKFSSPKVSISWRKSESVDVKDVWCIPADYLTYSDPKPNKTLLKKAIKEGQWFEGVELVETQNIQIK